MIIKKYLAGTEAEAIEMAKNELGSNAVVMNIKKVRPKGLARVFMKSKVEITAAVEEDVEKKTESKASEVSSENKQPDRISSSTVSEDEKSIQDKLMTLQFLLEKQMQENNRDSRADTASVNEVAAERKMEKPERAADVEREEKQDKTVACRELIRKQLLHNEVDEEIADSLLEEVFQSLPEDAGVDQILARVYQKIILMIGQPYRIEPKKKNTTQYIFFLGSTGVGKTTTIAKIASKLKLEDKVNVTLITADTYRIAAVEQLKTYANILSIPLKVIYTPGELGALTGELDNCDVCLVDTAGRSHKNEEQINDIRELIEQIPISDRQIYLVLNAGTKYQDLQEIASVYAKMTDFSIIFTKLDETSSFGAMLNMKVRTKCPISYVTWGQNVPDDMGEIDAQKIAKDLLSGNFKEE